MANRIPRSAKKLDLTIIAGSRRGEHYVVEKDKYGYWIGTDDYGRRGTMLVGWMRNSDIAQLRVVEQEAV